jgi:hypothetical protein
MPKRSNEFQKLILLVKQQITENATVTESKMLTDRVTGTEREVDVCIESSISGHSILISIECTDIQRPADVTWVEKLKAKHERLPTNILVLISHSGFTPEAINVAKIYGFETLALEEANEDSISRILDQVNSLWAKTWNLNPEKVVIKVATTADLPAEDVVTLPDNILYTADGREVGYVKELVYYLLGLEEIIKEFGRQGEEMHKGFVFGCDSPRDQDGNPLYMQKLEPNVFRPIVSIQVQGTCNFTVTEFPLKRGTLGSYQIVWGAGVFLGQKALLVASQDQIGQKKFTISTSSLHLGPKQEIDSGP